jgi:hypothetical protein
VQTIEPISEDQKRMIPSANGGYSSVIETISQPTFISGRDEGEGYFFSTYIDLTNDQSQAKMS